MELLRPPAPPELNVDDLMPSAPRRAGERYERVQLTAAVERWVRASGEGASVPFDLALTLHLEAQAMIADLEKAGVSEPTVTLEDAASHAAVSRALSAAAGDYLRGLSHRRWVRRSRAPLVPVRVATRLNPSRDPEPWGLLESAVRWEIAAVVEGVTMAEWGLRVALGIAQTTSRRPG